MAPPSVVKRVNLMADHLVVSTAVLMELNLAVLKADQLVDHWVDYLAEHLVAAMVSPKVAH